MSHGDLILVMFEKVCHGDNLFSVSYRQELRKSFLVPDFTTKMSLADYGISTEREIHLIYLILMTP